MRHTNFILVLSSTLKGYKTRYQLVTVVMILYNFKIRHLFLLNLSVFHK
jgi:hypothetical protein